MISLLVCLATAVISFSLIAYGTIRSERVLTVLRTSSLLNSVAIAGPLLYTHIQIWPNSSLGDFWSAIGDLGIGWYVALICGIAAGLLIIREYDVASSSIQTGYPSEMRTTSKHSDVYYLLALGLAIAAGVAAIGGFLSTWTSGSVGSFWAEDSWSTPGFEVSPLMYLIPAAVIISCALAAMTLSIGEIRGSVLLLIAQNLMITSCALTLSWGITFGEFDAPIPDMFTRSQLQSGWYVCVISQLILLVSLSLIRRLHSNTRGIIDTQHSSATPR